LHAHEFALKQLGFDERVLQKWHKEIIQGVQFLGNISPGLKVIPELYDDAAKLSLDIRILWGRRKGGQRLSSVSYPVGPRHQYLRVYNNPESWKKMLEKRVDLGSGARQHITAFIDKFYESPSTPTKYYA
jgi:hypothetical protein